MFRNFERPKWPNIPCGSNQMEYRGMMHRVIEGIKEGNMRMILYLCQDIIPHNQSFKSFLEFIQYLEKGDKVNRNDVSLIAEILYRINRVDLLKKIVRLSKSRFEDDYLCHGYTHFTPFRILMFELADDLGKSDFECLKHQCCDHMKQRLLDEATDVISLLIKLEELGVVEEDDFRKLIDILGLVHNPEPFRKFQRLQQHDFSVYLPEKFQKQRDTQGAIPFNTDNPIFLHKKSDNDKGFIGADANEYSKPTEAVRYNFHEMGFQPQTEERFFNEKAFNPTQNEIDLHNKQRSMSTDTAQGQDYGTYSSGCPQRGHPAHHTLFQSHSTDEMQYHQRNNHFVAPPYGYYDPKSQYVPQRQTGLPPSYSDSYLPRQQTFQTSQITQQQTTNLAHEMNLLNFRTEADNGHYKMANKPCGICIIINNKDFEKHRNMEDYNLKVNDPNQNVECPRIDLTNREGSDVDAEAMTEVFEGFSFNVKRFDNMKFHDMQECLQEHSTMDHSSYDCFVLVMLSHGKRNIVYSVDGYKFRISDIQAMFTSTECHTLENKPKLFFIQACGGSNTMQGRESKCQQVSEIHTDGEEVGISTPNVADFLLANATVPGYVSYRSTSTGSWFISALVNNLKKYALTEDLLSIIVRTNDEVSKNLYRQIPMPCITLRKKVCFQLTPEFENKIKGELANILPPTTVAMVEGASP